MSRSFCRRGFPLHRGRRHLGIRSLPFGAYLFGLALSCGRCALLSLSRFFGGSAILFCTFQRIFCVAQYTLGIFDLLLKLIDLFFGNRIPDRYWPTCCLLHLKTPEDCHPPEITISTGLAVTSSGGTYPQHGQKAKYRDRPDADRSAAPPRGRFVGYGQAALLV